MRIGIGIGRADGRATVAELVAQARQAEVAGFASGWIANIFGMDAMTAVAICGQATTRLELGTAVVPTYTRHPFAMAQQGLSTQAATGGRFLLGIGLSHAVVVEGMWGLSYARPLAHMREYLAVLAPLIRTGHVEFVGTEFRVTATLTVPEAAACPILLAALGPQMLALAGRVADGTITWMTGPRTLRERTVPAIGEAAAAAGRAAPRVVASLPVAVTTDVDAARAKAARLFAIYGTLPAYRAMLDQEGAADPGAVAIVGDADAVGEQLARLAEAGVTDFNAAPFPVGTDSHASLAATYACLAGLAQQAA